MSICQYNFTISLKKLEVRINFDLNLLRHLPTIVVITLYTIEIDTV